MLGGGVTAGQQQAHVRHIHTNRYHQTQVFHAHGQKRCIHAHNMPQDVEVIRVRLLSYHAFRRWTLCPVGPRQGLLEGPPFPSRWTPHVPQLAGWIAKLLQMQVQDCQQVLLSCWLPGYLQRRLLMHGIGPHISFVGLHFGCLRSLDGILQTQSSRSHTKITLTWGSIVNANIIITNLL